MQHFRVAQGRVRYTEQQSSSITHWLESNSFASQQYQYIHVKNQKPKALGQTLQWYMQAMAHEVSDPWQFPRQRISLVFAEH